jgi:hypothetical protein
VIDAARLRELCLTAGAGDAAAVSLLDRLGDPSSRVDLAQPLRQITGGIRSILHYDVQDDAGLTRGWVMMAAGLVAAALFGFGVLGWCDRKGMHRIPVEATPEKTVAPA